MWNKNGSYIKKLKILQTRMLNLSKYYDKKPKTMVNLMQFVIKRNRILLLRMLNMTIFFS